MFVLDMHPCHAAAKFGGFVDEDHAGFLCYTGYLNIIKYYINHVYSLILVAVLLLSLDLLPHCDSIL